MHDTPSARIDALLPAQPSRSSQWQPNLIYVLFAIWIVMKTGLAMVDVGQSLLGLVPLAILGSVLVISPWARLASGRWQAGAYLVLSLLLTILAYADILYFRQFGDLVSAASLRFAGQLGSIASSVITLMKPSDLWLWADLPVIAALTLLPQGARERWLAKVKFKTASAVALVGILTVTVLAMTDSALTHTYLGHTVVSRRLGLLSFHAFDTAEYLGRMTAGMASKSSDIKQVQDWFDERRQAAPPPSPAFGKYRGKNVIMLQVESLQRFPIGMVLGGEEITPNLNRLAEESLYFTNFYHQTGQGATADADLLANCSLHPSRTGAVYYDYAANDFRCTPHLVREAGYKAVAMQGMPGDFWNLGTVYPHVGFEKYYNIADYNFDEKIGISLSDESFLRQSVEKLKALPEPYYAFLVTLTSHTPFEFEGLPKSLKLGKIEGTKAANYLHAVHYTDMAIGKFMAQLKAEGILDKTVLMLYGDHKGIGANHPGMPELLQLPPDDAVAKNRAEDQVPFMIRLPGAAMAGRRTQIAGQTDIAPTLAGLLGIHLDNTYFMGRDLLAQQDGVIASYTGDALDNNHLYLGKDGDAQSNECYDVKTGAKVALSECTEIAEKARTQLEISRLMVEKDLIGDLTTKQPVQK